MKVLVVDDERTTRFLLSRALTRRFGCEVTEACHGDQALDALAAGGYGLIILDVQMPVIDGLQTLRIIRQSPDHASLPVVMLTGERDEAVIREILDLGVLEYMPKPLNIPRLSERLRRILRCIGSDGAASDRTAALRAGVADGRRPAVVIEGRAGFRALLAELLGARRPVVQAETGVRGIRDCLESAPSLVFVGDDLGVLNETLVARKIRTSPLLRHLPLVGIADDDEAADARLVRFDATLIRTSSREALAGQLGELARRNDVRQKPGLHPACRSTLLLVGEEVFRAALSGEVFVRDLPGPSRADRIVVSAAGRTAGPGSLTLRLACDRATARRAAVNLFGIDARMIREQDCDAAALKVFDLVSSRIRAMFADSGPALDFDPPTRVPQRAELPDRADLESGLVFVFQSAPGGEQFWLMASPCEGHETRLEGRSELEVHPGVEAVDRVSANG